MTVVPGFPGVTKRALSAERWSPVRVAQWTTIAILVVVSEVASWSGLSAASYGLDGLALLAFLGFRRLRRLSGSRG
jgi:hypothetical protein